MVYQGDNTLEGTRGHGTKRTRQEKRSVREGGCEAGGALELNNLNEGVWLAVGGKGVMDDRCVGHDNSVLVTNDPSKKKRTCLFSLILPSFQSYVSVKRASRSRVSLQTLLRPAT